MAADKGNSQVKIRSKNLNESKTNFHIITIFYNINIFDCFDQLIAILVNISNFFQKLKMFLNSSVNPTSELDRDQR